MHSESYVHSTFDGGRVPAFTVLCFLLLFATTQKTLNSRLWLNDSPPVVKTRTALRC